jgi:DNA-binding SARP family transcriptional activator
MSLPPSRKDEKMNTYLVRNPQPKEIIPAGLQSSIIERKRLLSQMMSSRNSVRILCAPALFGKSVLALQYAKIVFAAQSTIWVDAHDPRFLRDLDSGVMLQSLFSVVDDGPACELFVFDDAPCLSTERQDLFVRLLISLCSLGYETVITTRHSSLFKESYKANQVSSELTFTTISAQDLMLTTKELARAFPHDNYSLLGWVQPVIVCDKTNGHARMFEYLQCMDICCVEDALLITALIFSEGKQLLFSHFVEGFAAINLVEFAKQYPLAGLRNRGFAAFELSAKERFSLLWAHEKELTEYSLYPTEAEYINALLDAILKARDYEVIQLVLKFCLEEAERKAFYERNAIDEETIAQAVEVKSSSRSRHHDRREKNHAEHNRAKHLYRSEIRDEMLGNLSDNFGGREAANNLSWGDRRGYLNRVDFLNVDIRSISREPKKEVENLQLSETKPLEVVTAEIKPTEPGHGEYLVRRDKPLAALNQSLNAPEDSLESLDLLSPSGGVFLESEEGKTSNKTTINNSERRRCYKKENDKQDSGVFNRGRSQDELNNDESNYDETGINNNRVNADGQLNEQQIVGKDKESVVVGGAAISDEAISSAIVGRVEVSSTVVDRTEVSSAVSGRAEASSTVGGRAEASSAEASSANVTSQTSDNSPTSQTLQTTQNTRAIPSTKRDLSYLYLQNLNQFNIVGDPDRLVINLFGKFEVRRGGKVVPEKGEIRKLAKVMIGLLVVNYQKDLPRAWMEQRVWPGSISSSISSNFYNLWSYVKKALSKNEEEQIRLGRTRDSVSLRELNFESDVIKVDLLCNEFSVAHDPEDCARILSQLELIYQGPLLPGLDNAQVEAYRNRFQNKVLDVLVEGTRIIFNKGNKYVALHFAAYAFSLDITREDVCYTYMFIQRQLGHYSGAIDTYLECRSALVEEYGIDAPRRLDDLYDEIIEEISR